MPLAQLLNAIKSWAIEITASNSPQDAEREVEKLLKLLETPPSGAPGAKRQRWDAEDEMALFQEATTKLKGG